MKLKAPLWHSPTALRFLASSFALCRVPVSTVPYFRRRQDHLLRWSAQSATRRMEEDRGPDGVSVMSEAPERARPSQRRLTSFLSLGSGNEFACVVDALPLCRPGPVRALAMRRIPLPCRRRASTAMATLYR